MERAKSRFLFGVDVPPIDVDDDDALIDFFETDWMEEGNPFSLPPVLLAGAAKLIIDGASSAVTTVERLTESGFDRRETLEQIAFAFRYETLRTSPADDARSANPAYDRARLGVLLDSLPLADDAELVDAVEAILASGEVRDSDSLTAAVLAGLGLTTDAELMIEQVKRTIEAGVIAGVLQFLPGDKLVHVPTLIAGIVLTHRLRHEEIELDTLMCVGDDLAGFALCEGLRLAVDEPAVIDGDDDGDDFEIRIIGLGVGRLRWKLPDQALGNCVDGDLVAVRVDESGQVSIERIHDPSPNPTLVDVIAATYGREIEEIDMAEEMRELLVAVLAAERDAFAAPQPPLTELCQLAGLTVRNGYVGSSDDSWAELRRAERSERLFIAADGHDDCAAAAEDVLETFELRLGDDDAIRDALDELGDDHVTQLVADELIDPDGESPDRGHARVIGERLVAIARRGPDLAAAYMMLGVIEERSGEPIQAEECFAKGHSADPDSARLLDRLGWYASDRGDAKAAIRWWQMLEDDHGEMEAIAAFARSAHPTLGRNDPCWCGSGRKFKTCHLGVVEQRPLPERVGWIMHKSFGYVRRHGGTAVASVIGAAAAWAGDDIGSISLALDDPIVFDTVLTEGGWMARFLADRGPLLPADEAQLVQSWLPIGRSVYEFDDVMPGGNVEARDLRTGEPLSVRAHSASMRTLSGGTVLARAVPDGEGHQFIGAVQIIPADDQAHALSLCADADGDAICGYIGALRARSARS